MFRSIHVIKLTHNVQVPTTESFIENLLRLSRAHFSVPLALTHQIYPENLSIIGCVKNRCVKRCFFKD